MGMVCEMMSLREGRDYEEDKAAYRCRVLKSLCEELIRSKIRMRPNFRDSWTLNSCMLDVGDGDGGVGKLSPQVLKVGGDILGYWPWQDH